jgi:hypothetical protein
MSIVRRLAHPFFVANLQRYRHGSSPNPTTPENFKTFSMRS